MIFWLNGAVSGVLLAERINGYLAFNWESFASQNYFDPHGVFIAVLWSGPLLLISMLIVVSVASSLSSTWASPPPSLLENPFLSPQVNTLLTLVKLIIQWKRAELRHRARLAREKKE